MHLSRGMVISSLSTAAMYCSRLASSAQGAVELKMLSLREMLILCCERTGLGHFTRDERCMKHMEAFGVGVSLAYAMFLLQLVFHVGR